MARWVDVRVEAGQSSRALGRLRDAFSPVNLVLDTSPPAAGPEHEISVEGHTLADVERVLREVGVGVLAGRERLGSKAEADAAAREAVARRRELRERELGRSRPWWRRWFRRRG